jgi:hypothetical protein
MSISRPTDRGAILFQHRLEHLQAGPDRQLEELRAGIDEQVDQGKLALRDGESPWMDRTGLRDSFFIAAPCWRAFRAG